MSSRTDRKEKSPEAEHLGWRATSSMPSKKRNYIDGVSGRGVMELQAQLYRTQEEARMRADGLPGVQDRHVRRKAGIDVASIKNKGVEAREARDKALTLKSSGSGRERFEESRAALQRKAALYDRLAAQGGTGDDEQDERYEVEFWRKGASHEEEEQWQRQQHQQQQYHEEDWLDHEQHRSRAVDTAQAAVGGSGDMETQDMARERERRDWEAREEARLAAEAETAARREAHKAAIKELSAQTQAGRDEAAVAKAARDEALAAKREKLKAAFLSQQVKALKAGKQQKQQQSKPKPSSSSGAAASSDKRAPQGGRA